MTSEEFGASIDAASPAERADFCAKVRRLADDQPQESAEGLRRLADSISAIDARPEIEFPETPRQRATRKPRRSKNGTPEEKAGVMQMPPAEVVTLTPVRKQARSEVDGRKLRGSPLRDCIGDVSFGATVVGKMHTAGLKGKPLATIEPETRKEWLITLDLAIDALVTLGVGLNQAMKTLKALEPEVPAS